MIPDLLKKVLLYSGKSAILFSGGTDSEVLLKVMVYILGAENVISLTADTPLLAGFYRNRIVSVTSEIRNEHYFVSMNPLENPDFTRNDLKRCYICKREIFGKLREKACSLGYVRVMDGTNTDDLEETRPGLAAATEFGILHPFLEAGMGKKDIRKLGKSLAVPCTVKPSDSCLATRIIEGNTITKELIELVERMEAPLRQFVRGRLRVSTDGKRLTVNYDLIDSDVVEKHIEELHGIAGEAGFELEWLLRK